MEIIFLILYLTIPYWLTPIAIYVIYRISKNIFGNKYKIISTFTITSTILLIIFGQKITSNIYHNYLCENKAGWKNYNKIKLPKEYWNVDGSPKFIDDEGKINEVMVQSSFDSHFTETPLIDYFIKINQLSYVYIDKKTKIKVGEKIDYVRYYERIEFYGRLDPSKSERCNANLHGTPEFWRNKKKLDEEEKIKFYMNLFTG